MNIYKKLIAGNIIYITRSKYLQFNLQHYKTPQHIRVSDTQRGNIYFLTS